MAQTPQPDAADGGANIAQLCAAQKLLYADAIAAHPQNAAEASVMENKPLHEGIWCFDFRYSGLCMF
jgi:hypothetical protein